MTTTINRPRPVEMLATGTPDPHLPEGDPRTTWKRRKAGYKSVSPANHEKYTVIMIETGLAGLGVAAVLGESGYKVESFTFHDAPRRAHSVAVQGGINAARVRKVDGNSLTRFVTDTVEGGNFRDREADVWCLAEESMRVIDHMNAISAPFACEYDGQLATRPFGGVWVSRTYYTRGQTGQQLQIAGAQALLRQVEHGTVKLHTRHEMLDLIVADGRAQGVVVRDLVTGWVSVTTGHAVVPAIDGHGSVFFHSALAMNSNAIATWWAHRRGAFSASPSFTQFHPTALPVSSHWQSKTTPVSESPRNDGRIWVPVIPGDERAPGDIPETEYDYYLERRYPAFGNLTPRDITSRATRTEIKAGRGVGPLKNSVYLDFRDTISQLGRTVIAERYGDLFEMYRDTTGKDPYEEPMRTTPGAHFTMGGLWCGFNQMTGVPGLFVGGEAGSNYHGVNRFGANSLFSVCVNDWFTLLLTIPNYLAGLAGQPLFDVDVPEATEALGDVRGRVDHLVNNPGHTRPAIFHRRLGEILYTGRGVSRSEAGLTRALEQVQGLCEELWRDVRVTGTDDRSNQELGKAGWVADFLELAELMITNVLDHQESCETHFRKEYALPDGEVKRDDKCWCNVPAWETSPTGQHRRYQELLRFGSVKL